MITALGCGVLGLWVWPGPRQGLRMLRRLLSAGLLLCGLLAGLLAIAIFQYQPFRPGTLIAEVAVRELPDQQHAVTVSLPGQLPRSFVLQGDQWQFDVRLLRWQLPAALLGAPRLYLPERLSSRYVDIEEARRAPRSVHALATPAQWDAWQLTRRWAGWMPFLEADFGSSAYLPLIDGTRIHLRVGDVGGIVAQPADAQSAQRLRDQTW